MTGMQTQAHTAAELCIATWVQQQVRTWPVANVQYHLLCTGPHCDLLKDGMSLQHNTCVTSNVSSLTTQSHKAYSQRL